MRTRRARTIVMVITLVVIATIIVLVVRMRTQQADVGASTSQNVMGSSLMTPPFTKEQAQIIETALSSPNKGEQAKALAPALRQGAWDTTAVLPAGARLSIDPATFRVDGNGVGFADATVSGSVRAEFVFVFVFVGNQWLVYTTQQKG